MSTTGLSTAIADSAELKERIGRFQEVQRAIVREVRKVIVGQEEVIEQVLISLFVGGHCLITGLPGTAKTLLVRTLAQTLGLIFKRIQFTPDLMPSDITGTDIIEEDPLPAVALGPLSLAPSFLMSCWPTKSTAPLPRRSRRCSKPCRSSPAQCAGICTKSKRHSSFWRRRTPSNSKAPIRCPKPNSIDPVQHGAGLSVGRRRSEGGRFDHTTHKAQADTVTNADEILDFQQLVRMVPIADTVARYAVELVRAPVPTMPAPPIS